MGLQFVQLRCRSATRWPTDARLDAIAGDASKPGKRHRHCAKRRRYAMAPPVLQMAFSAAGRAARPLPPVAVGLRRNDRSLNARQKLLRFGQGQSQVSNIAKTFRPADLYQIGAQAAGITLRRNQPQHPSHPRSPGRLSTRPIVPPVSSYPHSLDTPPAPSPYPVMPAFTPECRSPRSRQNAPGIPSELQTPDRLRTGHMGERSLQDANCRHRYVDLGRRSTSGQLRHHRRISHRRGLRARGTSVMDAYSPSSCSPTSLAPLVDPAQGGSRRTCNLHRICAMLITGSRRTRK